MALLTVNAEPTWNTGVAHKSDIALVLTVNKGTGQPIEGLQEDNFSVFETAGTIGPERSRQITPLAQFNEHPAGGAPAAYCLGLNGGGKWGGSIAIFIVDVEVDGDRGRATTSVRF